MSRVEAASGAKYSVQKEAPRQFQPIAPVGTNYQPVGKVDMASLKRNVPPPPGPSAVSKPPAFGAPRSVPMAPSPAPGLGKAPVVSGRTPAPAGAWEDEAPSAAPPPPPAATRPPVVTMSRPPVSVSLRQYYVPSA